MKLGLKTFAVGALVAAMLVPAAAAKPGQGQGQGQGAEQAHGKPAWAGQGQERKAENAARNEARREARSAASEDAPKHDNPAWTCKFERDTMGAEAFAEEYGENESNANAFGKCVSSKAQDQKGTSSTDDGDDEDGSESGESDEEVGEDGLATLQALFQALRQLVF